MARSFTGSSQYGLNANAVVAAAPLTMAAWVRTSDVSNTKDVMAIGDTAANNQFRLRLDTSERVLAGSVANGPVVSATSSTAFSADTWFHACAVFASPTSRAAYLNGAGKGTNATSNTPSGLDTTVVGGGYNTGSIQTFIGQIAEAAIWNVALTDAEVAMLAKGVAPYMVRPESLVAYWPLVGRHSPEPDIVGGFNLTLSGSPAVADHARVFYAPKVRTQVAEPPSLQAAMAATETPDVVSFSVDHVRNVTIAASEAADTFAATARLGIRAALAATEAPDVMAAVVAKQKSISMAATEAPDTADMMVRVTVDVSMAATESPDVAAFVTRSGQSITLDASESPDTMAAAVLVPYPPLSEIVQGTSPGALIFLYELDLTSFGADIARFTPMVSRDGPDYTEVRFGGNVYTPIPLMAKGFEKSAKGALARPRLQISNVTNLVTQLLRDFGDLKGVRLTRIRTFAQYLDAPDGISPDTGQTLPVEEYIISRKAQHNKVFVEFELRAAIDIEGVVVPKRVLLRNCMARARIWDAATETFTYDTSDMACPYDGSFYFTKTNAFTTDPAEEGFAKTIDCCKTRFGERAVLPYHGFPGAARVR